MTAAEFRRLALALENAAEGSHMGHADFRAGGKVFATIGYPRAGWAMVKLTPLQQETIVRERPGEFVPVAGAWGRRGATNVRLAAATKSAVREALALARSNLLKRRRR